ncbi:MAG: Crp/Fnr family transcriptional regulator [Gammaproteobacteria bacterium]|nr:Crp/Fnr family transcriptional regulator [Gammaproteobacteria bacterium]
MSIVDWTERFQGTRSLPRTVRDRLLVAGKVLQYHEGDQVFRPDKVPDSLFFLYEGTLRVSQAADSGSREIVLYRVEAGESCVLTTACMLAEESYNTEGYAESDITAVVLPKPMFDQLVAEEPKFRQFVFSAYSRRLIDLLRVVDDVAFGRIDVRLAQRMLELAGSRREISATHQELANELGTAREVISRVMHDFQKRGLIVQSRGRVTLCGFAALQKLARSI